MTEPSNNGPAVDRRTVLRGTGLTLLALGARPGAGSRAAGGPREAGGEAMRERLAAAIQTYDRQGIHRTGTPVDEENARWLVREAQRAGAEAEARGIPFSRLDLVAGYVELASGRRIEGIPLFDAPATGPQGRRGRLGAFDSDAPIGFGPAPPSPAWSPAFFAQRSSSSQQAQIAVTGGKTWGLLPGYALINAERYTDPFGPPVLQVGSEAAPLLEEARGEEVRVVVSTTRRDVQAYNVTATVPGSRPGLAPVVVMTPRSGWWHCASERGGGIALWLELLRHLGRQKPARTTHFVASTGHELGHLGLESYLEEHQERIAGAHAWLHLGANFAAAHWPQVRLQASDAALLELAERGLERFGTAADVRTPLDGPPLGEARNIHAGGGRYLSILGRNGLFHHPDDRWPEAVDLDRLQRQTEAFVSIVDRLVSEPEAQHHPKDRV